MRITIAQLGVHPSSSVLHRILEIRLEYDRTAAICEPHMDLVGYMVDGIKIAIIPRTLSPPVLKEIACDLQVLTIALLDSFHDLRHFEEKYGGSQSHRIAIDDIERPRARHLAHVISIPCRLSILNAWK